MTRAEISQRMDSIESEMERLAEHARTANTKRYREHLKEKFLKLFSEYRGLQNEALYQTITGPSREQVIQQRYPDGKWVGGTFVQPIRTTGELYGPNSVGWARRM
jgi:hypothetical protein